MLTTNPFTEISERLDKIDQNLLYLKEFIPNNSKENAPEKYKNISQAAQFLNLAVPTLYTMVSKKQIKFYKRTKRLYFLESDLLEFIRIGKKKSISEIEEEVDNNLNKERK